MTKKSAEEKISIKNFKDGSSSFWCNNKHYFLNENNELIFVAGGIEDKKETEEMLSYIKRNKKKHVPRKESIFEQEQVEWIKLSFGKYTGKTLDEVKDIEPKYCAWLYKNTNDSNVKAQLKILLKK